MVMLASPPRPKMCILGAVMAIFSLNHDDFLSCKKWKHLTGHTRGVSEYSIDYFN